MDRKTCRNKLRCLFEKLLQPNFELSLYYANNLIKHFHSSTDEETCKLLESPLSSDLLLHILQHINKTKTSVKIFILNFMGIIARNELQFTRIIPVAGLHLLSEINNFNRQDTQSQDRKVACIEAALALLNHHSGIAWLLEMQIVQKIFEQCYQKQTAFVLRAAYTFISDCLWKFNEIEDKSNLLQLLDLILTPFVTSPYHQVEVLTDEIESTLVAQLEPTLQILMTVLKKNMHNVCDNSELIILLYRHFAIDVHLCVILWATKTEPLACKIAQLTALLITAKTMLYKPIANTTSLYCDEEVLFFNTITVLLQKRMDTAILDFAFECILYWSNFGSFLHPPTFERYGRTFKMTDQILTIPLVPLGNIVKKVTVYSEQTQQFVELYRLKLSFLTCERSVKAAYLFRDLIEEKDIKSIAIQSMKRIFRLKGHITDAQAISIFPALFYVLKYYVYDEEVAGATLIRTRIKTAEDIQIISLLLDATIMIINDHDINWRDSYEIICLYKTVINFTKVKILPSKCLVKTLDLLTMTVKKCLCPDLALLQENKDGSLLTEIGVIIRTNITDSNWEVRDSAVSLILACTELAFIKFPPFQRLISANNLISMVVQAALSDDQFYVQANALKCLSAATKMENIWKELLKSHPNIYTQLAYVLKQNQEGIVRKEAAVVLREIYVNQKVLSSFIFFMYDLMYSVTQRDLHWEVQIAALHFWKKAIQKVLAFYGMIDGKFPSVTFSQVYRKIVTLNAVEIEKRIVQIMNQLASMGCLTVLVNAMNEDLNLDVMEEAISISKELYDIIINYKVEDIPDLNAKNNDNDSLIPSSVYDSNSSLEKESFNLDVALDLSKSTPRNEISTEMRDKVIESIINTDYCDLLEDIYSKEVSIKSERMDEDVFNVNTDRRISPNEFINNFKTNDYISIIKEKKKWNAGVRDLNYVLDEILSVGQVSCVQ